MGRANAAFHSRVAKVNGGLVGLVASIFCRLIVCGQPGSPDLSFDAGSIVGAGIGAIAVQGDGRILIGGGFTSVNGVALTNMARLYPGGGVDLSFNASTSAISASSFAGVGSFVLQTNGSMIVAGAFQGGIIRLKSDGSVDPAFNAGSGANGAINCLQQQSDGQIIVGGSFTAFNGATITNLARLSGDGSLDPTFNPGLGAVGTAIQWPPGPTAPQTVGLQPDGHIIVGGPFTNWNGASCPGIARLNVDGSLDNSFQAGSRFGAFVRCVKMLANGTILALGQSQSPYGPFEPFLVRLLSSGGIDPSFSATLPTGVEGGGSLSIQPDGRILVAEYFSTDVLGPAVTAPLVYRLNPDGNTDPTFNGGFGVEVEASRNVFYAFPAVNALALQADGGMLIAGAFDQVSGVARSCIARLMGGTAPLLLHPMFVGTTASFLTPTISNQTYRLQMTLQLNTNSWSTLFGFTGNGSSMTVSDSNAVQSTKFYRLISP
jgi:uncharacterized delta-60 repeat protein